MGIISAQLTRYPHLIHGFLVFAILLFSAGSASAGAVITACNDCHNMPPKDGARTGNPHFRSLSSATEGSHEKHLPVSSVANDCVACHGTAVTATGHQNDGIDMDPALTYGKGIFFNMTSLPVTATCATASCHNDGRGTMIETPAWGVSAPKCTVCHVSRPTTGSHIEHLTGPQVVCASCHNGAVESSTFSSLHSNNLIDVYKTNVGDLGYPAGRALNSPYTTCTTASCHIDPSNTGAQKTTPVWGDTSQPKCSYCHASRPATGSHTAHFNAGFALCSKCHVGAVEGVTLPTTHSNNLIDIGKASSGDLGYTSPKAIGSAYSTCSTGSCHEDGRGNFVTSPTWGTPNNDCSACHANLPSTGSHVQHVTGVGVACGQCHKGAAQGTTVPLLHMNDVVDVYRTTPGDFGGGYPAAGKTKGSAFASCTTVNCHGRLSPVWGGNTSNFQCTKCHGMGVPLANYSTATFKQSAPGYGGVGIGVGRQAGTVISNVSDDPKVGAHDTHLRGLNNLGKPAVCTDCHTPTLIVFRTGHMDGSSVPVWSDLVKNKETISGSAVPYTFAKGVLATLYNGTTGACSATYCHGATLPGGSDTAPKWNDGTYLTGVRTHDCAQCHGYPPVNSTKQPHNPALDYMTCTSCHPHDGSRQSTDPLLGNDYHMNGTLEAYKFCNTCHDYDTRGPGGSIWGKNQIGVEGIGAHAAHINYLKVRMNITKLDANVDTFGSANYNGVCGVCHTRDINNHNQGNRTNAQRSITFGDISSVNRQFGPNLPKYNGTTYVSSSVSPKTCSNVDCHYQTSPVWQSY